MSFRRSPRPLAQVALLLLWAATSAGCFASLFGGPTVPDGFERMAPAPGAACPWIAGAYVNRAAVTSRGDAASWSAKRPQRHLAAFFAGVEAPEEYERVVIAAPAAELLEVRLVHPSGPERRVVLRAGADFTCRRGEYVFEASPLLRRRAGASIRLGAAGDGCVVERTHVRNYWMFLVPFIPIVEWINGEWSRFCPPAPEPGT